MEKRRRFELATLLLAVVAPLAAFLMWTWLHGWQLVSVQSGSMEPTYHVGSMLVVEPIDASQVQRGMAIVFRDPRDDGRIVTHRVVGRAPGETLQFLTQGDANATADPAPVPARMVQGRVRSEIVGLGLVTDWLRWPRSFVLLVVVPGLLLASGEQRRKKRPTPVHEGPPGDPARAKTVLPARIDMRDAWAYASPGRRAGDRGTRSLTTPARS
jgi:signal peptidase